MPELPEVEVVRRGLEAHVVGHRLASVEVLHPRPVRRHLAGVDHFCAALTDREVVAARRRGKYLWLPLDSGDALLAHLGMSGQMLVQPAAAPPERHLRVRFALSGAGAAGDLELRFVDQRMFGGLAVSVGGADLPSEIAHIAADPLEPEFDEDEVVRRASGAVPPGSSGSSSTRGSSRGSATSTRTRRCGGPGSTATGRGTGSPAPSCAPCSRRSAR